LKKQNKKLIRHYKHILKLFLDLIILPKGRRSLNRRSREKLLNDKDFLKSFKNWEGFYPSAKSQTII
jgi:hypothetical protein